MKGYTIGKRPQVVFGSGVAEQTGKQIKDMGVTKCMVVADKGVIGAGIVAPILKTLEDAGIEYIVFDNVLPDPPDYICLEAASVLKNSGCNGSLAIGGGSSIDTAKAANLIANIPEEIVDLHDYGATGTKMKTSFTRSVKFVAIPTTSGTASEVSPSSVISDTKRNSKYSFINPSMLPDLAIIDPLLTLGMPPLPTAFCGLDALCHAVEGAISPARADITALMLNEVIARIWKWLPVAVREPGNVEAREQMAWAAHNAQGYVGKANGHAVGHAIGATYHMVHGHACIVSLPSVIRHFAVTSAGAISRIADIVGVPSIEKPEVVADRVAAAIKEFYKKLGVKTLREYFDDKGITDDRATFCQKLVAPTLDGFMTKLWAPPIHDNPELMNKVFEMIYDDA